jgi:hypothetical protein
MQVPKSHLYRLPQVCFREIRLLPFREELAGATAEILAHPNLSALCTIPVAAKKRAPHATPAMSSPRDRKPRPLRRLRHSSAPYGFAFFNFKVAAGGPQAGPQVPNAARGRRLGQSPQAQPLGTLAVTVAGRPRKWQGRGLRAGAIVRSLPAASPTDAESAPRSPDFNNV